MQATWGGEKFGNTTNRARALTGLDFSASIETTELEEAGENVTTGANLDELSLTFTTTTAGGGDPRGEIEALKNQIGQSAPFYLNGRAFAGVYFQLLGVSASNIILDNRGNFLQAEISLSFKEDPTNKTADIKVYYDGVNIADSVSIQSCIYDEYAESRADKLTLVFNDPSGKWDKWTPSNSAIIRVVSGAVDTGKMFIYSVEPKNEVYTLKAFSIPHTAKSKKTKSWEKVSLKFLAQEIAAKHGLSFEAYGVGAEIYDYITQEAGMGDFAFLQSRAELEGCAFLVYDKKLCLYSEKAFDAKAPAMTVELKKGNKFDYKNDADGRVRKMVVVNERYRGTFTDYTVKDTQAVEVKILKHAFSNQAEANRMAAALLRKRNKYSRTGTFYKNLQGKLAAGSVIRLKTETAKSWNGSAFIYQLRHDLGKHKTKFFVRKTLSY